MYNIFKATPKEYKKPQVGDKDVVDFLNGAYEKEIYGSELMGIRAIETSYNHNNVDIVFCKSHRWFNLQGVCKIKGRYIKPSKGLKTLKVGTRLKVDGKEVRITKEHRNSWEVDTDLGDEYISEGVKVYKPHIKEYGTLKPFCWTKGISPNFFFKYNIVELPSSLVAEHNGQTYVKIEGRENPNIVDGDDVQILEKLERKGEVTYNIRYKIETQDEWDKLYAHKKEIYGVTFEKQITSFEKDVVDRMKTGFRYKATIADRSDEPIFSDNPYFKSRRDRIKGSLTNLMNFFKEGGVNPRGNLYLDVKKLRNLYTFFCGNEKVLVKWFIDLQRFKDHFNPFTKKSAKWSKIIEIYKNLHPNIAFKIDKDYIYNQIAKDPQRVFKTLEGSKYSLSDLFDIELDDKRLVNYIVDCYCFDDYSDKKDVAKYFKDKGISLWNELETKIFSISPREQYMIQTGRRLFKGIENYEELDVLILDIETKAQEKHSDYEQAALFPEFGYIFEVGLGDNKGWFESLNAKDESEEQYIIEKGYEMIAEYDPDIILTHNGEGFDWNYMEKRLEYLGCKSEDFLGNDSVRQYIRELVKPYYEDYDNAFDYFFYNRKENRNLKVGGGNEKYTQTTMFGKNICDTMFAVKRAQAIDKSIPNLKLKDNIKHANLAKKNRVYVEGDLIGKISNDPRPYYFNKETGEYFVSKKETEFYDAFEPKKIKQNENKSYFYGNINKLYFYLDDGTECIAKDCINVHGFTLHHNGQLLSDNNFLLAKQKLDDNFLGLYQKILAYDTLVFPSQGFYTTLEGSSYSKVKNLLESKLRIVKNHQEDVKNFYEALKTKGFESIGAKTLANKYLKKLKKLPEDYTLEWEKFETVSGSYIIQRYLKDDIEEPYLLDKIYSQSTFEICKWLPTSYEKVATMGNANVWKMILSAWSYLNCLAIPDYEEPIKLTGGLIGMVSAGFHRNIVKIDYSSLYPSEFLQHVGTPDVDISDIYKPLVKYGLFTRLRYKKIKNEAKAAGDKKRARYYDKKQLPLKILINSFYGMLGAPQVSPFSHILSARHITTSGRQHMRHLIHYFQPRGFKITYFHTDGANFVIPNGVDDYTYIGRGKNWLVEKGKKYKGVEAYVAEYNDKFMRGRMGVDIDDYAESCVNFAKGNFSSMKEYKGEIKISHVGGTLVRSNQPQYIVDFLDQSLEKYFKGRGSEFIDDYYDYIRKIYNGEILARKICSKAKMNKTIEEYLRHVKFNNGNRLAYYELAIKEGLDVKKGDIVYYINTGDDKNGEIYTDTNEIGYFEFPSKKHCMVALKKLEPKIEDRSFIKNAILKSEEKEMFVFKNSMVRLPKPVNGKKTKKVSKKTELDKILKTERVELKYKKDTGGLYAKFRFESKNEANDLVKNLKYASMGEIMEIVESKEYDYKQNKDFSKMDRSNLNFKLVKQGKYYQIEIRPYSHIIKVEFKDMVINSRLLEEDELDSIVKFNSTKAIQKFNQAIEPLWIAFHPDVRDRIPTVDNSRGWFTDDELEMVSDFPLKGKEDNQADLEERLVVTEDEMDLWEMVGLSPNNPIDEYTLDYNSTYWVTPQGDIYNTPKGELSSNVVEPPREMSGKELAQWLSDKIILDYDNPPYRFIN